MGQGDESREGHKQVSERQAQDFTRVGGEKLSGSLEIKGTRWDWNYCDFHKR